MSGEPRRAPVCSSVMSAECGATAKATLLDLGSSLITEEWERAAAEAAFIVGKDAHGNKAVIISPTQSVLTFPRGFTPTSTTGDVVSLTFPFYEGGPVQLEGRVMGPISYDFPSPVLSYLVSFKGDEFDMVSPSRLDYVKQPKQLTAYWHLLLGCDGAVFRASVASAIRSKVNPHGSLDSRALEGRSSHGDAVVRVENGEPRLLGITYDHGDCDGVHEIVDCTDIFRALSLAYRHEENAELLLAAGLHIVDPVIPYQDGEWNNYDVVRCRRPITCCMQHRQSWLSNPSLLS